MEQRVIAVDGPVASGKSTLARRIAKHFGIIYVDTGALYRCIALYALRNNADTTNADEVNVLLPELNIELRYDEEGVQRMFVQNEDVTDDIRIPEVSMGASAVSAIPAVRDFLLDTQRDMATKSDVIMDGRDIGTVVLPNAGLKIFMTADPMVRAKRRYLELSEKNIETTFDEVYNDVMLRDKNDSEREVAPLRPADDSIILDTTDLSFDESFDALCSLISGRFKS
jgi:cytidylate kinase